MPIRCAFGFKNTYTGVTLHVLPIPEKSSERFKTWVTLLGGKLESPSDYKKYRKKGNSDNSDQQATIAVDLPQMSATGISMTAVINKRLLLLSLTYHKCLPQVFQCSWLSTMSKPVDLSKPRYDQSTYTGRAKHFLQLTNPLNLLASEAQLDEAKRVLEEYKKTHKLPPGYNEERLWANKYLYDSAFHPDTGEKMFILGRMSAQPPMNTIITGCMITFYKTTAATIFWQWVNQSFNAVVNYTNRSGDAPLSTSQLLASYCAACGGALGTALYLNNKVKKMKPIYARLVPFAAVCGANFINIPMMRSNELLNGTPVVTAEGARVGESKRAARLGIGLVCVSRVLMAVPGMTLTPLVTSYAAQRGLFCRRPWLALPFQLALVGLCVTFATPLCCALFPQRAAMSVASLEPQLQEIVKKKYPKAKEVYFNKGL